MVTLSIVLIMNFPVPCPDAPRLSSRLLGCNKWVEGDNFLVFDQLAILILKYRCSGVTWYTPSTRVTFSTLRREWEFLLFNLAHRDETRIFWHLISGFETRSRKILLQSRSSRRDRDLLSSFSGFKTRTGFFFDLISVFETRTRVLSC